MIIGLAQKYIHMYQTVLDEHKKVFEVQPIEVIGKLIEEIHKASRVFAVGAGREGIVARSLIMRIMHLGKEAYWIWDDTTPGMKEGDLFIAVNGSGKIGHIDYLIDQAAKTGARIAVITGSPHEHAPQMADLNVFVPACVFKGTDERVIPSIQPMGNLYEQHLLLLFDIVIMIMAKEMNMTSQQMESRHRNIE